MPAPVEAVVSVGRVQYRGSLYDVGRTPINASASGNNTLVAAVALKKIIVLQFMYERSAAVTITMLSSGGRVVFGPVGPSVLGGGAAPPFCPVGVFETDIGEALIMSLSGATQTGGFILYILV